ncbi:glycosyltransferase family 4 protein [Glutamicibacter sp. 287]|uniref:glycosyltransferase family 4 protein n=1 Tax=unclassified Glutamicibacter TaxID=2627139 RepID=UPI004033459C
MKGKRPKLLLIHSSDELYGSDRILVEVVDALREDFEILVWLPTDHQDGKRRLFHLLRERQVSVEHVDMPILRRALLNPRGLGRMLRLAPRMLKLIRGAHADQVYLMTSACLLLAPLARLAGVARATVHIQEPWGKRESLILRQLARLTQQRIAISEMVAQSTGFADQDICVVNNAVARLDRANPPRKLQLERDAFERPSYVVASRWAAHKGHETLLRAWEQADCPGFLYVLGSAPDGPHGVDIAALVSRHVSRPETVKIIGQVDNPQDWFESVDAMILPTDTVEGCGLVPIEGFRHGKAAIVSDSGGPGEVVNHGKDGWIFATRDVPALAQILRSSTKNDLSALGAEGQRKYEEKYTPERFKETMREKMSGVLLGR